jgi:uncharacterized membrane protein
MLYKLSHHQFTLAQLGGLSEILPGHREQRLATTGIRAHVRHPVYLGHLCEMLAWSVGTGLAVCWALTAFAIVTGAVMIAMEDKELEARFGEELSPVSIHRTRSSAQAKVNRFQLGDLSALCGKSFCFCLHRQTHRRASRYNPTWLKAES